LNHLDTIRPTQLPLLKQQKSIKSVHSVSVTTIPNKPTTTLRQINQKVIVNKHGRWQITTNSEIGAKVTTNQCDNVS